METANYFLNQEFYSSKNKITNTKIVRLFLVDFHIETFGISGWSKKLQQCIVIDFLTEFNSSLRSSGKLYNTLKFNRFEVKDAILFPHRAIANRRHYF